jgi:hypothetical protein
MRNLLINITLMFIALCTSTDVAAQNNKTSVSVGVGQFFNNKISGSFVFKFFGTTRTQQTSQFTPVVAIKLEKQFWKRLSLGLDYNRLTAKSERAIQTSGFFILTTQSKEKIDAKISGFSVNSKYFIYSNTALDAYIGANIGFLTANENIDEVLTRSDNPTQEISSQLKRKTSTSLLEANLGVRYFVTNKWNIYGEIGVMQVYNLGGASFQGGVIYRF